LTPDTAATAVDTTTGDDRTFSVAGLVSGETYRITLVACANVRGTGSDATFLAEALPAPSTGFAAVTGGPAADITVVNGTRRDLTVAGEMPSTETFVATGTTATFVIDGDTPECVVPVVYFDSTTADPSQGGTSTRLEVAGPAGSFGAPVEEFDIGGRTTFI